MGKRIWKFVATLVMLLGIVTGCSSGPTPEAPTSSSSPPAAAATVFRIPKVDKTLFEQGGEQWADPGFLVAVLNCDGSRRLPATRFDTQLRVAWDEQGLLFKVDVTDDQIHESDSQLDFSSGTSVEVFEADPTGKEHWHATISPSVDPVSPKMRISYWDDRSKAYRSVSPSIRAVANKTPTGYALEATIPWPMIRLSPAAGQKVAFGIRVNKPDAGHLAHLLWPTPWAPNADARPQLLLANEASPPIRTAIDGDYERLHRARISVAAVGHVIGKTVRLISKNGALAEAPLKPEGRLFVADIGLPMPAAHQHASSMDVQIADRNIGSIKLANADEVRAMQAAELDVVAASSVFNQRNFPEIDFPSPAMAEDLLGNYMLHSTYYDANYNVVTSADVPGRYGAVVQVTPEFGKPFRRYVTLYRAPAGFELRSFHLPVPLALPDSFGIDPVSATEQLSANSDFITDQMRLSTRRDSELAIYLAGLSEIPPGTKNLPTRLAPLGKDMAWWYGLQKKLGQVKPYHYLVHLPKGSQKKYPLILFLHGSGERGAKLDAVERNGLPRILKNDSNWKFKDDFIVVSPQCPVHEVWNPLQLRDLVDKVSAKYPVDPDRIYLTGLSMGGFGAWETAAWFPDRFAAIAPVCGGGDPREAGRLGSLPIWVFHGGVDPVVPIQKSYEMVQALRDLHARVRFTVYPDRGHNSWVPAYDEDHLYDWFLQQRRGNQARSEPTPPARSPRKTKNSLRVRKSLHPVALHTEGSKK